MKLTENKPHSVHLRLTEQQWAFCNGNAELMGVGVSDFIRMVINTMAVTSMKASEALEAATLGNLGSMSNENETHA